MDLPIETTQEESFSLLELAQFTMQYIVNHEIQDDKLFLMTVLSRTVH